MATTLLFGIGVLMLFTGIAGLSFVSRRKSYRRNLAGVEQFAGYGKIFTAKSRENTIEVVSRLLIVFGVLVAVVTYIRL